MQKTYATCDSPCIISYRSCIRVYKFTRSSINVVLALPVNIEGVRPHYMQICEQILCIRTFNVDIMIGVVYPKMATFIPTT